MRSVPQASQAPLFGVFWAFAAVLVGGWRFGVADHGIHLATIDMVFHPQRWAGDLLLDAAPHHHSWLPRLLAPAVEAVGAAPLFAGLHWAVLVAIGAVLWSLAGALGAGPRAAAVASLACAVPLDVPGGAATLDPIFLHRMAALPLELGALLALLRGRLPVAFGLVGLAANLHAPSAVAAAAGLAFGAIAAGESARRTARALAVGALVSAPTWIVGLAGGSLGRIDAAWEVVLRARVAHHLFPSSFPAVDWIVLAMVVAAAGVAAARDGRALRVAAGFGVGGLVFAVAVGSLLGPVVGSVAALQLQAWQVARLVAMVAIATALATPRRLTAAWVALALVVGHADEPRRFEPMGPSGDEAAVARWAATHTAEGDAFFLPPHRFDAFRATARRPVVVTWKEGGEATFDRAVALEWRRRVESACGCSVSGPGGLTELRARLEAGWAALPRHAIHAAAAREGADWVVLEAARAEDPVFATGRWAIERAPKRPASAP